MTERSIVLESAEATREFGFAIAKNIGERAIITVSGPLGAGKTTLAQGVALGLGIDEPVTSPTFTMMNEYDSGRVPLFHLDLYRLHETGDTAEFPLDFQVLAAELDEIMAAPSVVLVEWAEFFSDYFNVLDRIEIFLDYSREADETGVDGRLEAPRKATLRARGSSATSVVELVCH